MSDRGRSKLRRRDIPSYRHFQQAGGSSRVKATKGGASELEWAPVEPMRSVTWSRSRPVEAMNIVRLDGDSIAYFWALEKETAIAYDILTRHWQACAGALRTASRRG